MCLTHGHFKIDMQTSSDVFNVKQSSPRKENARRRTHQMAKSSLFTMYVNRAGLNLTKNIKELLKIKSNVNSTLNQ